MLKNKTNKYKGFEIERKNSTVFILTTGAVDRIQKR